jgi:hypothetical protein
MATSDNGSLVKKTLVTTLAMVGACTLIVGMICLIAVSIIGRAVHPEEGASAPTLVPADKIEQQAGKGPQPAKVQLPKTNPI